MSLAPAVRVGAASLNQTVGDWRGNTERIVRALRLARARGVRLLALPEMCIPGYSLCDRLFRAGTLRRSWEVVRALLPETRGLVTTVGLPVLHEGVLYNAMAVLADGALVGVVAKENLASGDVQYESRYFQPWPRGRLDTIEVEGVGAVPFGALVFELPGLCRFALEICEDGWKGIRPGSTLALAGAEVLLNPSASWFVIGKHRVRRRLVEQVSQEDHCAYVYTSLLGCDSTRLVFDGSLFVAADGTMLREGRRFRFTDDIELIDAVVDLDAIRLARLEEGSWREQAQAFARGELGAAPQQVRIHAQLSGEEAPAPGPPWYEPLPARHIDPSLAWLEDEGLLPRALTQLDLNHIELELALCMGLRDYAVKSGVKAFALALSGGRDSSMVAVIVARMWRYMNPTLSEHELREKIARGLYTAYMGTANSGPVTRHAALALAEALGATHREVEIQGAVNEHVRLAEGLCGQPLSWDDPADDIPLQNVQARLRGSLIWMLANVHNALLLSTSNQSEAAVGYATMDGDTSGGLSPLSGIPKSLITLWLSWAETMHGIDALKFVNVQAPTAELRPPDRAQTDEGDLMPFRVLDQLMFEFVQQGRDPKAMFQRLWPQLKGEYGGDPWGLAKHIRKFVVMLCRAQWKRERFAISFRVAAFDLDPKTGFRFPPVQAPFTEELEELDAYVAALCAGSSPS
ncbi:MAG: NAD(+) synthase [Deltaproteobacteria bacterium]|nr:NAD(+) synthase [Deltaproteobacteria bacterium]